MPVKSKVKIDPNHQNGYKDSINVVAASQKDFDYFYERWVDIKIVEYGYKRHRILHCILIRNHTNYRYTKKPCLFLDGDYTGKEKSIRTFLTSSLKKRKLRTWSLDPYETDEKYKELLRDMYLYFLEKPRRKRKKKKREELVGRKNLVKAQANRRWKHYWRWILENKWRIFENDDIYAPITWKLDRKEFRRDD
jgi:hypothetical protein